VVAAQRRWQQIWYLSGVLYRLGTAKRQADHSKAEQSTDEVFKNWKPIRRLRAENATLLEQREV
jgi:hypothetical protein